MIKFRRKAFALILTISILSAVLPVAVTATPVTDGHYIKLEELDYSNREAGFSQNNSVASMSGGKVRVNWATTYGELDFTVNIPSAGQYTIWVYGGESGNTYVSPSKLILDNTTDLNWETVLGSTQESGMSFKTAYHSVTTALTAGTHTIKYILTGPRPADNYYAGAFDFMMIMPANYTWTPSKTEFPTAPSSLHEDEFVWLEELDYSNREAGFSQNNSVASMSGGRVRVNWATTYGELDFTVNIIKAGEYTLWVHGGESGNTYVSPSKLILDNTIDLNWEGVQGASNETGMSFATAYHRVTAELTAGIHTIKYILTDVRPAGTYYAGAFDFMAIVPANAPFTPVIGDTAATKLDYYMSMLLLDNDLSDVTEDLTLPDALADDTPVTWSSNNTSIIANDGTVTRPSNGNAHVNLSASAGGYTKIFAVTVTGLLPPVPVNYAWLEETDADYATPYYSSAADADVFSGGSALATLTKTDPGPDGHKIDFTVNLEFSGIYDIYYHGNTVGQVWASPVYIKINGSDVYSASWILGDNWKKIGSNSYPYSWSKVSSVKMKRGDNTISWSAADLRSAGTYYMALFDSLVIVPAKTQFDPVSNTEPAVSKADYEMAVLMSDYDLKNLKGSIILPSTALNGQTITWSSSDPSVIAADGTVTRSLSEDRCATLTAVTDSYTKTFDVKVKKLTDLEVSSFTKRGSVGLNKTITVNADLFCNKGASKDATVAAALYDNQNKLLMCAVDTEPVTARLTSVTAALTIPSDYDKDLTGAYIKAFLWSDMTPLGTLSQSTDDDFFITELGNAADFHTDVMEKYLEDSYDSIFTYADNESNIDKPEPLAFQWRYLRADKANVRNYTLRISENSDMSGALEYTVKSENTNVYNLKTGTDYYWTVTANYADSSVTSSVSYFRTKSHAPRVLSVGGIHNARDLGGWYTVDGKRVKQGLVYRSGQFDYNGEILLTDDGMNTVMNFIGLRTEIDLRNDSNDAGHLTAPLGVTVNYYNKALNYNDDYLDADNRAALKEIFEIFADESSYPVDFHCAAGADRTGMVAYFLNGLLGVREEDLYRDYLFTNFTKNRRPLSGITGNYVATVNAYRGDTLQEKIYNYLSEVVGISRNDLDFIISYMTE